MQLVRQSAAEYLKEKMGEKMERMNLERIKAFAEDIYPLIRQMEETMKEHGIEGMTSMAVNSDGYVSLDVGRTGWEIIRLHGDSSVKCRNLILHAEEEIEEWRD